MLGEGGRGRGGGGRRVRVGETEKEPGNSERMKKGSAAAVTLGMLITPSKGLVWLHNSKQISKFVEH